MAIGYNQKNYQETIEDSKENFHHLISGAFIPFSKAYENEEPKYIYRGNEKIPFNEQHPKYKKILLAEFVFE